MEEVLEEVLMDGIDKCNVGSTTIGTEEGDMTERRLKRARDETR